MYIVVQEGNEQVKDHLHLWFYGNPTRYKLSKVCGKGNACFSLSKCKEKYPYKYWNYMTKQNTPEYVNLPTEQLELFKEYQDSIMKIIKEPKKKVWEQIMSIVIAGYKEKEHTQYTVFNKKPDIDSYILSCVIEYHKENKLVINKNRVFSYIDTIKFNLPHKIGTIILSQEQSMLFQWTKEYKKIF